MDDEGKKKIVESFIKKGVLLSPDFLDSVNPDANISENVIVLSKETAALPSKDDQTINWKEIDRVKTLHEKGKTNLPDVPKPPSDKPSVESVQIISSYLSDPKKKTVDHFTSYFKKRYELISRVLQSRPELQNLTKISGLKNKIDTSNVSIIGMINEKRETINKHLILTIEDPTGPQKVIVSRNKSDIYNEAKELVTDEVVGVSGSFKQDAFFPNNIVIPDIPETPLKKSPVEEYMACMSDLHFGSKQFMPEEFNKFLSWLNLETGTDKQKKIAEKLKYVLIAGDIVDGIGIYQNQESELEQLDVKKQYESCAKALARIPEHIKIVISPGNHDALRMAEPQPPLKNDFSESLSKIKNAVLVSNPATVRIGAKENFPGFTCLLYHGYSFDYYVANVDAIRLNGGYERADLIMKFLLRRRHLAPAHTSTLINPTPNQDALFIEHVPDFFIAGHIHRTSISSYRSTTLINSSCWQSMTSFQERLGHNPQPARLPLVNLKTRAATIINFSN